MTTSRLTSVMEAYLQLMSLHPGVIILLRVGDFHELFFDHAKTASRALGVTLTMRDKSSGNPIPTAGFPHHQLENYLRKLTSLGHRVAVCEYGSDDAIEVNMMEPVTNSKEAESKAGDDRVNPKSKAKSIAPNATEAKPKKASKSKKSTKQGPVKPVPQFESKAYGQMRMIRDIAIADKPNPKWRPKIGDLVFIPATVDEQVEVQNTRYGWVDYVQKKNPVLSPRALVARVIAYTQCDDLIKIRDVEDQVWKCKWVKSRFILISSVRPFRGWDEERRKRLDPVT